MLYGIYFENTEARITGMKNIPFDFNVMAHGAG